MWMQYSSVHAHTHFKSPFTLSGSKKACCMLVSYPRAPRNAREKFFPQISRRDAPGFHQKRAGRLTTSLLIAQPQHPTHPDPSY